MKNKKLHLVLLSGTIGIGVAASLFTWHKISKKEPRRQEMIKDIRDYFSYYGEIEVLFVNNYLSEKGSLIGGIVMEDGRRFNFTYSKGDMVYEEDI